MVQDIRPNLVRKLLEVRIGAVLDLLFEQRRISFDPIFWFDLTFCMPRSSRRVLRVFRDTGSPAPMRDTNNFAPPTKDCTTLKFWSSKFEFILLRPTMTLQLCTRDGSGGSLEAFSMLLGSSVALFIPPALAATGGILLIETCSSSSNPGARAHKAAGDASSSKTAKANFGEMFDMT
jgi:hypothetical protein